VYWKKTATILLGLAIILGLGVSVFADGFIVVPRPPRPGPRRPVGPFPLEVQFHHVDVKIRDQFATTTIDQVFFNPTGMRLEGYYLFPVPRQAVIKKFSMFVNGSEVEAELLNAGKARRIYEDIVRRMRDPALLEYSNNGVFKVRLYPIEPFSKKRVKITYHELLTRDDNTIGYLYPLNTEKFSAAPLKDVSVKIDVQSKGILKNIYCPTHETEIIRKGRHRALVGYEEKLTKPDIDFKLYFTTDDSSVGFSLLSYKRKGEDGYFFLSLNPSDQFGEQKIVKKDIVFVLDVSGSMAGEKMDQAKKALLFCVENLNPGDRFDIIRFSTEAEALFGGLTLFNKLNKQKARKFVNSLKAIGGTNIDEALSMALRQKSDPTRPYMIIFLTDGKPTIGETDESRLVSRIKGTNLSGTRIFTFGIGHEINTHLLDKITEATRAYRSYISPLEDIEVKVSRFYTKVQSPVLTDIKLVFNSRVKIIKTYPNVLPDLFKGSTISIFGRYRGSGKTDIILEGKMGDRHRRFTFKSNGEWKRDESRDSEVNDFIAPLWASRRIGYLLDQIRLHGKSSELVEEITVLARRHGIITPYTSYLIVEDERSLVRRRKIRQADQTLAPASGKHPELEKRNREEFLSIDKKSGSESVRVSKEFQQLNRASNYAQMRQGKSRLDYVDRKGNTGNIIRQVKNIQGRAVYQNGKYWVDSFIQNQAYTKTIRIQFGSAEYFNLLKTQPESAQFLALGKQVRFVVEDSLYEIYE
jgi:Ca-activated chloride channel family protein